MVIQMILHGYNQFMNYGSLSRSNKEATEAKTSAEELRRIDKQSTVNLINGKSHSSSTNNTPHKKKDSEKQSNFIQRISQFPKKKAEVNPGQLWDKQFREGVSPEFSINVGQPPLNDNPRSQALPVQGEVHEKFLEVKGDEKSREKEITKMKQFDSFENPFKIKGSNSHSIAAQSHIKLNPPESSIFTSFNNEQKGSNQGKKGFTTEKEEEEKDPTTKSISHSSDNLFKIPAEEQRISKTENIESNLFQLPKRESQSQGRQSQNKWEFQLPTFKLSKKKDSIQESSDDQQNLYEFKIKDKSSVKQTLYKSNQGYNMFTLEKILGASGVYKDYLKNLDSRTRSICVYEADLEDKNKLPLEFFFKPERVLFSRIKGDIPHEYNFNGNNIICKVNEKRTRFFFQDLKQDQLKNMKGMRCNEIFFPTHLQISRNVEYDYENKRFFIFSNYEQAIYVFSETSRDLICSFKANKKVWDPQLYLHQINDRLFLLLIGGYTKIESSIVQGSKFIQIFEIRKWEIQLKSQLFKLVIGRISPLVVTISQKNQTKILIMGGNSIATIDKNGKLNYEYEREINQSTNLTGVSLLSQEIIELFDYQSPTLLTSHPINILNPFMLHDGCVIPIKNTFYLLLPESKYLIQMKMFKKEIHLIQGKRYEYIPMMSEIQRRELCLNSRKESGIQIYRITDDGLFSIINHQTEQKNNFCLIY